MSRDFKQKYADDGTGTISDLLEPNIQNKQEALEQKQDFLLVNSISPF